MKGRLGRLRSDQDAASLWADSPTRVRSECAKGIWMIHRAI